MIENDDYLVRYTTDKGLFAFENYFPMTKQRKNKKEILGVLICFIIMVMANGFFGESTFFTFVLACIIVIFLYRIDKNNKRVFLHVTDMELIITNEKLIIKYYNIKLHRRKNVAMISVPLNSIKKIVYNKYLINHETYIIKNENYNVDLINSAILSFDGVITKSYDGKDRIMDEWNIFVRFEEQDDAEIICNLLIKLTDAKYQKKLCI